MKRRPTHWSCYNLIELCLLASIASLTAHARGQTSGSIDTASLPQVFASELPVSPSHPMTLTAYWENDGGPLKRNDLSDRHYTNGFALSLSHQPQWAQRVAEALPFSEQFDRWAVGYLFGQLMFTPDDISARSILKDDRPYAGYLFGGVYLQRANDRTLDHFQLELGLVGSASQADEVQRFVHKLIDESEPQGWDVQLRDEVTVQFYLRKKWRIDLIDPADSQAENTLHAQLIPQAGLAVGTVYRYFEFGATARLGVNLPDDFGPGRLANVASATGGPTPGWGFYVFGRAGGRLVEHNLFLEGSTFRDSPQTVQENPLVGEFQAGLALAYHVDNFAAQITYSQTYLTEEFEGQNGEDAFGALTLALTWWF